jgi:mRNA interferase MazF
LAFDFGVCYKVEAENKISKKTDMDRETEAQELSSSRVIRRGEIFWVPADPTKGSVPGVPHPHVVIQDDVFNDSRISTVIVCAVSSNINKASEPGNILLDIGEGDLKKQSVVIVSQVASIYKSRLGERIGKIDDVRVRQIIAGLRFVQSAFIDRK